MKNLILVLLLLLVPLSAIAQETNNALIDVGAANAEAAANAVSLANDLSDNAIFTAQALVPLPPPPLDPAEKLNKIFAHVGALKKVKAAYVEGVVTLTGETLDDGARTRAEEIATKMDDVIYVENQITHNVEISDRVEPVYEKTTQLLTRIQGALPLYGLALLIMILAWWLGNLVRQRLPLKRMNESPLSQGFVREALRWVVVLMGVFLALETVGVTSLVTALMGGAGILGVGLGFAFQDIIENYLAGILLGTRQPFHKNDLVRIGEYEGKVVRLTSRETVLMTLSGNHLTIPNATVFKGILYNFTKNPLRRFEFVMGVATNQSMAKVMEIGAETLVGTPGVVVTPKPTALIQQVGSYTLDVNFTGWIDQTTHDFFAVRSEAIRRVNRALMNAGIDLPEPMVRTTRPPENLEAPQEEPEDANVDVTPDTDIDKQIEADREITGDKDLLGK